MDPMAITEETRGHGRDFASAKDDTIGGAQLSLGPGNEPRLTPRRRDPWEGMAGSCSNVAGRQGSRNWHKRVRASASSPGLVSRHQSIKAWPEAHVKGVMPYPWALGSQGMQGKAESPEERGERVGTRRAGTRGRGRNMDFGRWHCAQPIMAGADASITLGPHGIGADGELGGFFARRSRIYGSGKPCSVALGAVAGEAGLAMQGL